MLDPSTQGRVIAHAFNIAVTRQQPIPARLAEKITACLTKSTSRNRIKNREGMKKAARFQAENPNASLRALGEAAGVHPTVIRKWKTQYAYKRALTTQLVYVARELYESYVKRFGSPFAAAGLPEPHPYGLAKIRGAIDKAMADGKPITDRAVLERAMHDPFNRAARGGD